MPQVTVELDVDIDFDDLDDLAKTEIIKSHGVDAILYAFDRLLGDDLEKAFQAIRDRSAHDLAMVLG